MGGGDTELSLKGGGEGRGCFRRVDYISRSRMSWQEIMCWWEVGGILNNSAFLRYSARMRVTWWQEMTLEKASRGAVL